MSYILYISFANTCHFLLCFMSANTLEVDTGNYKGPKALYTLCETVVYKGPKALLSLCKTMTIYKAEGAVMTQTGPTYQYAADLFFPNRHAHLSLYQVLSRQSMCILFSVYISYSRIIIVIR